MRWEAAASAVLAPMAVPLLPGSAFVEIVENVTPPTGVTRLLFRLPLYLYRSGLGWLFGHRLMVVNHIGRVTGKRRPGNPGGGGARCERRQLRDGLGVGAGRRVVSQRPPYAGGHDPGRQPHETGDRFVQADHLAPAGQSGMGPR
jgi:hypothetical protein